MASTKQTVQPDLQVSLNPFPNVILNSRVIVDTIGLFVLYSITCLIIVGFFEMCIKECSERIPTFQAQNSLA